MLENIPAEFPDEEEQFVGTVLFRIFHVAGQYLQSPRALHVNDMRRQTSCTKASTSSARFEQDENPAWRKRNVVLTSVLNVTNVDTWANFPGNRVVLALTEPGFIFLAMGMAGAFFLSFPLQAKSRTLSSRVSQVMAVVLLNSSRMMANHT